jgi:hypothetical protein
MKRLLEYTIITVATIFTVVAFIVGFIAIGFPE